MEDRILSTVFGSYAARQWDGANLSGIQPLCDKVLVLPDQALQQVGGIIIPDQAQENQGAAATTGVLVACGPQAFAYDSNRLVEWVGDRPQPGCRVYFQKYAGQEYTGADGQLYRLMDDRCVAGMEIAGPAEVSIAAE